MPPARMPTLGCAILWLACARPVAAQLVINELLPDPAGADEGREYVELLNTGGAPRLLDGVSLEFANGADGAVWSVRWQGTAADTVAAGGRFVIVDRNWQGGAYDAQVSLALQNGPDAIRLASGPVVHDLVGYGALTDGELFEGAPAPVSAGRALARRPDGADSDDNAADFVAADPTPGAANFLPYALTVTAWGLQPPSLIRGGAECLLSLTLRNDGTEVLPSALLYLRGGLEAPALRLDAMPPAAERTLTWRARGAGVGTHPVAVVLPLETGRDSVTARVGRIRIGAAAVGLSEVLAAPADGQGEWIELECFGPGEVELDSLRLRDADGDWRPLPALLLRPGERVVLAQDVAALASWVAANGSAGSPSACPGAAQALLALSGWPSLNNTPPADRIFADRVLLGLADGSVLDHVDLGLPDGPDRPGRSLERIAADPATVTGDHWAVCTDGAGSTPGCANSVAVAAVDAAPAGVLQVVPPLLDRSEGPTTIQLRVALGEDAGRWSAALFDLWGDAVREFGGDALGSGQRVLLWDGRDDAGALVAPGGYIALVEVRDAAGAILERHKSLVVVR